MLISDTKLIKHLWFEETFSLFFSQHGSRDADAFVEF